MFSGSSSVNASVYYRSRDGLGTVAIVTNRKPNDCVYESQDRAFKTFYIEHTLSRRDISSAAPGSIEKRFFNTNRYGDHTETGSQYLQCTALGCVSKVLLHFSVSTPGIF